MSYLWNYKYYISIAATLLKKMKDEAENHNRSTNELDDLFDQYRNVTCHIQYSIDAIK